MCQNTCYNNLILANRDVEHILVGTHVHRFTHTRARVVETDKTEKNHLGARAQDALAAVFADFKYQVC